ncbi:MAG TPA: Fic family protein [Thermoanaerobaculia bacterium]|nr:Fic family protein [Thermoanaerobaculia bacterium]
MNPTDFRAPEAGRLVHAAGGVLAFVPSPLPPKLSFETDLVNRLSRADALLGELSGLGQQLPNPHLLIAPYTRREAVLSSRIEGTRTTLSELLLDELGALPRPTADVREVRNYVAALEHGIERLKILPLSLRLVRELHLKLLSGVRGEKATPGEFRRSQNWIGPPGSTLETAAYVPPPHPEMTEALHLWEGYLHQRGELPDLVQCALIHEQFEAIHPFLDGNGRIGRLLITLFLIERGRLAQPLLYISSYLEPHRTGYYEALQRVRTQGDWAGWVRFFLTAVEQSAESACLQARRLLDLRTQYRDLVRGKPRALTLLDELFASPYVTVSRAAKVLAVSPPTARAAIKSLMAVKLLDELAGSTWRRVYVARPILEILES